MRLDWTAVSLSVFLVQWLTISSFLPKNSCGYMMSRSNTTLKTCSLRSGGAFWAWLINNWNELNAMFCKIELDKFAE